MDRLLQAIASQLIIHHEALAVRLERTVMHQLTNQRTILMALQKEVQDLLDAVAAQTLTLGSVLTELHSTEQQVVDLKAQLAALPTDKPIDAEDLAGIVQATQGVLTSIGTMKAAIPQTAEATVVAANTVANTAPADAPDPAAHVDADGKTTAQPTA